MLQAIIKGVLPSGEFFDRTLEGDLVSVLAIKNEEDCVAVNGCSVGSSDSRCVTQAIISSLFKAVKNEENEQELLKMSLDQIEGRLDELAERAEEENAGRPDVKVAVISGSDAAEFLKGLLGGR